MGAKIFISWMPGSLEACSLCSHLRDSCLLVWCSVERLQKVKTKLSKEHLSRTQGRVLGVWILHPTPQMWPPVQRMTGRLASSRSFRDRTIWQLSSVSPGGNRAMFWSFSLNWLWTSPWGNSTQQRGGIFRKVLRIYVEGGSSLKNKLSPAKGGNFSLCFCSVKSLRTLEGFTCMLCGIWSLHIET